MDRNIREDNAKRLAHLRSLLGMSQRQMAEEFYVAHGAISNWETEERNIPGPVLRLMEIYEDQLGMVEKKSKNGIKKLNSSWISRTLKTSATVTQVAGRLAGSSLRQLVAGNETATRIKQATEELIAREVTESLGQMKGLLMKMGQILSYMDFALPENIRQTMAELQDNTIPMNPDVIEGVVIRELGDSPNRIFKEWSKIPFAAASIGQVHRAELKDGTKVAVKVQYPEITRTLESDLRNTAIFDKLGSAFFRYQDKGSFLEELKERLLEECDYEKEAKNIQEFRELYAITPNIMIPRVFEEYSTKNVLTTEFAEGKTFKEFMKTSTQDERNRAGELMFEMAFRSLFIHYVFNCDPHPGNYLFRDGQVVFLDFGCVKKFKKPFIETWKRYVRSVLEKDRRLSDQLVIKMGFAPKPDRFDFDHQQSMILDLYEPWLYDETFKMNRSHVAQTWKGMISENPNKFTSNLPKDWVFTMRLQWGLYSVLAEMGAEANWRRILLDLLYEKGDTRPPPFKR